jgi:hypothetical protein
MSLDLSVPLNGTLEAALLVQQSAAYYRELLGLPVEIPLRCIELSSGQRISKPPIKIDVDTGYLLEEASKPEVMVELGVLDGPFEFADQFAWATAVFGVSVRGSEGEPRRLALGAAVAAAAARLGSSKVYDDMRDWSEKEFSDANEFVDSLRGRAVARSADAAAHDFRLRMWNRGSRRS